MIIFIMNNVDGNIYFDWFDYVNVIYISDVRIIVWRGVVGFEDGNFLEIFIFWCYVFMYFVGYFN